MENFIRTSEEILLGTGIQPKKEQESELRKKEPGRPQKNGKQIHRISSKKFSD